MPPTLPRELLFPRVHGMQPEPDDDASAATHTSNFSCKEEEKEKEQKVDLAEQLLGMPGGLTLDAETSRYARVRGAFSGYNSQCVLFVVYIL